jgi:S-adenosyl-L-methionine hydrolase (adenosine-forming)
MSFLTLLTDFGHQDCYVGVMRGVIATIAPTTQVIDLTHEIPPQDIATARFQWMSAYAYFPKGTVHLAVVDPGVGSQRRAIAVALPSGYLVAPDNGLISGILELEPPIVAVELTDRQYWRTPNPSATFHGRDIFAAVAAHLSNGLPILELGPEIDVSSLVQFSVPTPQQIGANLWQGVIQAIDRFGNLITNLPQDLVTALAPDGHWDIQIGKQVIPSSKTYADRLDQTAIALVSSENWIEIAIVNGNAQKTFNAAIGQPIQLRLIR